MEIYVKYSEGMEKLKSAHENEWIDLRAGETVTLKKGESYNLSLGVAIRLPEGYEAHICPRSSTFGKYGVIQTNGIGIIDNLYSGNADIWHFPILAVRDTTINKNDRVAQFRLVKQQEKVFVRSVFDLGDKNRGGFGSTGTK